MTTYEDYSQEHSKMFADVRNSVNVTRGEFESLQHEVKFLRQMLEAKEKQRYNIPEKVSFIKEIARLLNLSLGEVKELKDE